MEISAVHSDFPGFQGKKNPPAFIFQDFKISLGQRRVEAACDFGCRRMFTCRVHMEFYNCKEAGAHTLP